ncbi:MAG: HPr family phosphocarrier protein [Planctomycetota bacterium]|nr:HPr family phosphocarrier protein [Planctomycetota bacterium]MDA1247671.1 HPr family phosphocarrier protein [Planctomycetota bacterium]
MSGSVARKVLVKGENGLHLVPCSQIAQCAGGFDCEIRILKGDRAVDASNIFDLMSLNAGQGCQLELQATGPGSDEAVDSLAKLFESDFQGHVKRAD